MATIDLASWENNSHVWVDYSTTGNPRVTAVRVENHGLRPAVLTVFDPASESPVGSGNCPVVLATITCPTGQTVSQNVPPGVLRTRVEPDTEGGTPTISTNNYPDGRWGPIPLSIQS